MTLAATHPQVARPTAADWLLPISAQEPCGPSLEYDAEYAVLLSRMTPRGEAQYGNFVGAPEAPHWAEIERDCRRLLLRSKDISLFVWLCRARTRLGQAAGLTQVLGMLAATLQAWPDAIHPQAVVEGQLDPAVRANALAALADPEGLMGDVREIVVAASTAMRLTVRDVERAFAMPRPADAPSAESVSHQLAALRAAAAGDASAPVTLLAQAAQQAHDIDAWSKDDLGTDAPALQAFIRLLDPFRDFEREQEPAQIIPLENAYAELSHAPNLNAVPRTDASGAAASRADMLRNMRATREWFETHEPSSPVAVLIKQAERMVGKRFSQVADLIPLDLLQKWECEQDLSGGGPA